MKATTKLSSEERRQAIVKAVRRVFAEKGFHGTTTRALAEAAGVSEALLFKHFPNKESLYAAMQLGCCADQAPEEVKKLIGLEPSTSTLVLMIHYLVSRIVMCRPTGANGSDIGLLNRLMLQSLMEDGGFARQFLQRTFTRWGPKFKECIKSAAAAGELIDSPVAPHLRHWFAHHLAAMLMINLMPATPVVDYGVSREKLVEQAVWFILRGVGLTDEAVQRYYNPKALALLTE